MALAKTLGVTIENTFVIGDNYNDLKMLNREVAGMIACPANSVPTVKKKSGTNRRLCGYKKLWSWCRGGTESFF